MVVLFTAALVYAFTADLGRLKPHIERLVSERVGRELSISTLEIRLGRQAVVNATDLTLDNAAWASEPDMVRVDRLALALDLRSLLQRRVQIENIDVANATVQLEENEDGAVNWSLASTGNSGDAGKPLNVLLKQAQLLNINIVRRNPEWEPRIIHVESLRQDHLDDDTLDLSLSGTARGRPIRLSGNFGTWQSIVRGTTLDYKIEAQLDTLSVTSEGHIDSLLAPRRPSLEFEARGANIDDLAQAFGLGDLGVRDIDFHGSLQAQSDGPLVLDVRGNIGDAKIEASGDFSDLQDLEQADLKLDASGPRLAQLLPFVGKGAGGDAPFEISVDAERHGPLLVIERADAVVGEQHLNLVGRLPAFPTLDHGNLTLDAKGANLDTPLRLLGLPGSGAGPYTLNAVLEVSPEGDETVRLKADTTAGRADVTASLGESPDYVGTQLRGRVVTDSLKAIGVLTGVVKLPDVPVDVSGAIAYVDGGLDITDTLDVKSTSLVGKVKGKFRFQRDANGSAIAVEARGDNLDTVVRQFGITVLPAQPYEVKGGIGFELRRLRLSDVAGRVGQSQVAGSGLITYSRILAGSDITVNLSGSAIEEWMAPFGEQPVAPGRFTVSGQVFKYSDTVELRAVKFDRDRARGTLDATFGWPLSRRYSDFALQARGDDVRQFRTNIAGFEPLAIGFSVDARGTLRDTTWSFDKSDLTLGPASISAQGDLDYSGEDATARLQIDANVPSLPAIGTFKGRRFRDLPLQLNAKLATGNGLVRADDFSLQFGDNDLTGFVSYDAGEPRRIEARLHSDILRIEPPFEAVVSTEAAETAPASDRHLVPAMPFSLAPLRKFAGTIELKADKVHVNKRTFSGVDFDADIGDGGVTKASLDINGLLKARSTLSPTEQGGSVTLDAIVRDFNPDPDAAVDAKKVQIHVDLRGTSSGADLRELAANASGAMLVDSRGGQFARLPFERLLFSSIFEQVFSRINPFSKTDPFTSLDCLIMPYSIENGVMTSAPAWFVQTDKYWFVSHGHIDLDSEKIELGLRTTPHHRIGISAGEVVDPYLKVVGTIAKPQIAVDEKGAFFRGGLAVATGGLSIFGRAIWDRLPRSKDPCGDAVTAGREALDGRLPDIGVP